jgi:hypothetical protein
LKYVWVDGHREPDFPWAVFCIHTYQLNIAYGIPKCVTPDQNNLTPNQRKRGMIPCIRCERLYHPYRSAAWLCPRCIDEYRKSIIKGHPIRISLPNDGSIPFINLYTMDELKIMRTIVELRNELFLNFDTNRKGIENNIRTAYPNIDVRLSVENRIITDTVNTLFSELKSITKTDVRKRLHWNKKRFYRAYTPILKMKMVYDHPIRGLIVDTPKVVKFMLGRSPNQDEIRDFRMLNRLK